MPRAGKVKLNKQQQVTERDVFRYSTPNLRVIASPLDTYERPPAISQDTKTFVDMLSNAPKDFMAAYTQKKKLDDKQDTEAGQAAALRGEELQTGASDAFAKAYYFYQGRAALGDYRQEVEALYSKSADMDPAEFQAQMHTLQGKYLKGRNDAFINGFAPAALEVEDTYTTKYQRFQQKLVNEENKGNVAASFGADWDSLLESNKNEDGTVDKDGLAQTLRDYTTHMQKQGKNLNLTSAEVSEVILDRVGAKAIELGKPELLDFVKVKDASGISIHDTSLFEKAESFRAKAETAALLKEKTARLEHERVKKEWDKQIQLGVSKAIYATEIDPETGEVIPKDPQAVMATIQQFEQHLTPSQLERHYKYAETMLEKDGFALRDDISVYREARIRAKRGRLTDEDFMEIRRSLTFDTVQELGRVNSDVQSKVSEDEDKRLENIVKSIAKDAGESSSFFNQTSNSKTKMAVGERMLWDEIFRRQKAGEDTSELALMKWWVSEGKGIAQHFVDSNASNRSGSGPSMHPPMRGAKAGVDENEIDSVLQEFM